MNIAIIGTSPLGIMFARLNMFAGNSVFLYDVSPQALQNGLLQLNQDFDGWVQAGYLTEDQANHARKLVVITGILEQCCEADFIMEFAPEQLEVKKALLEKLDSTSPQEKILATSTRKFPITTLAASAKQFPQRVIGIHCPSLESGLIELIRAYQTSQETVDKAVELMTQLGKKILIAKDISLLYRLTDAYTGEALRILGEGQISVQTIDRLMESVSFPQGSFKQLEAAGLEESLAIKQAIYEATFQEPRYRPHVIHAKMVQAGQKGFYAE